MKNSHTVTANEAALQNIKYVLSVRRGMPHLSLQQSEIRYGDETKAKVHTQKLDYSKLGRRCMREGSQY